MLSNIEAEMGEGEGECIDKQAKGVAFMQW